MAGENVNKTVNVYGKEFAFEDEIKNLKERQKKLEESY